MFTLKYFREIECAKSHGPDTSVYFDLGKPHSKRLLDRVFALPLLWRLVRQIWPIVRIGRLVIVTRAQDAVEVLQQPDTFEVPFGIEMTELAGGADFILGMEGKTHDELKALIHGVLQEDDLKQLRQCSRRVAQALIDSSGGEIDVMHDFFMRVVTETCITYFGLEIGDRDAFADWTLALSKLLFADPFGDQETRKLAIYAAARLRSAVDRAIGKAKQRLGDGIASDTLVDRLVRPRSGHRDFDDATIRATLIGLSVGFIPTTTTAAAKMLEELLGRKRWWSEATKRAMDGDANELQAILREAARLDTAVPVQLRYAAKDGVIAKGTSRQTTVPENSVLMVVIMSALRDGRVFPSPDKFDQTRKQEICDPVRKVNVDLMFGAGPHWCLGQHIAMDQITEMFRVLLSQKNLRPVVRGGQIKWLGPFPRHFDMQFEPATGTREQSMVTICAPVLEGVVIDGLIADANALGNPADSRGAAGKEIATALDDCEIVHFASLTVANGGDEENPSWYLVLELNVDGPQGEAIETIASKTEKWLSPIFCHTAHDDFDTLADILRRNVIALHRWPWGAIGLDFSGTGEFSVRDIGKQARLADFARNALDNFLQNHSSLDRAMLALDYVRKLILPDATIRHMALKAEPENTRLKQLMHKGAEFSNYLIRPSGRRLQMSVWTPPTQLEAMAKAFSLMPNWARAFAIGIPIVIAIAIYQTGGANLLLHWIGRILLSVAGAGGTIIIAAAIVTGVLLWLLHYYESKDRPEDKPPPLSAMRAAANSENHPRYAQNHFTAVTPLKSGWFRKLTLAAALWGVRLRLLIWDRPGFVTSIGTIHYAKWFRMPGTNKLVFLANYDGSWESYLEDFITKAHLGQTAVWSNGVGFPSTRFLLWGGAEDGDRFKRWVRRQQVVSQFWYSRYPELTTDQIRNNALILDGLARASTDTAARAWLGCFGSIQRPEYAIETEEVQSLVFRAFGKFPYSVCALLRFPEPKQMQNWLSHLLPDKSTGTERPNPTITFGDYPITSDDTDSDSGRAKNLATFVAFSALGLEKLGLPNDDPEAGLSTFPSTFILGMTHRSRVLGDFGDTDPHRWRWFDAVPPSTETVQQPADAVLYIFANDEARCQCALEAHLALLGQGALLHCIPTKPAEKGLEFEHFGFRDGISQPVIRGTQRFANNPLPRDIVEPGEFILGYRNNQSNDAQSYFPPSLLVRAATDLDDCLPVVAAQTPPSIPDFDSRDGAADLRDFGRNGTFLVIRQLAQNVKGFHEFAASQADALSKQYSSLDSVTGTHITREWVEAKMVGRWHDGTPLIDRPHAQSSMKNRSRVSIDNDFTYGIDDPRGISCPLGAHIRRTNPRDSLLPGSVVQQAITNRHRLLRRGRTYDYCPSSTDSQTEQGLMFVCLCTDLERQFEFVQQTWVGSPFFHGLVSEPDPLVGADMPGLPEPPRRMFTIPTSSGPLTMQKMKSFVAVRGGGYFFLPSRSAIEYLIGLQGKSG